MESESSTFPEDFEGQEDELRRLANKEFYRRLKECPEEVPSGQLSAFVAKVGFRPEPSKPDGSTPAIGTQNILAILPGLPPERQDQIIGEFKRAIAQAEKARKELSSGG